MQATLSFWEPYLYHKVVDTDPNDYTPRVESSPNDYSPVYPLTLLHQPFTRPLRSFRLFITSLEMLGLPLDVLQNRDEAMNSRVEAVGYRLVESFTSSVTIPLGESLSSEPWRHLSRSENTESNAIGLMRLFGESFAKFLLKRVVPVTSTVEMQILSWLFKS